MVNNYQWDDYTLWDILSVLAADNRDILETDISNESKKRMIDANYKIIKKMLK